MINILIGLNILLIVLVILVVSVIYEKERQYYEQALMTKSRCKSKYGSKDITNKQLINNMTNVEFLKFIKERFNFPDYCKMCDNFKPNANYPENCIFKGLFDSKCKEGFEMWLNNSNNLEGDMDANIN